MPPRDNSPYRLLVEGLDDKYSVVNLMARHGFDWDNVQITRPYISISEGVENLLQGFPVAVKSPYDRLGVLVDANTDVTNRWVQLRDRASSVGLELPGLPVQRGTIVDGLRPQSRVGIWLMPDNLSPGTLESFLGRLVPEHDPVWNYADDVVVEARRQGAPCRESDQLRCRLYTWLAWQEKPGLPFGTALNARIFLHDTPEALAFVAWFRQLFVEPLPDVQPGAGG